MRALKARAALVREHGVESSTGRQQSLDRALSSLEGELAIQERAGATAQGRNSGRMISDSIIPGAIKFVKKQPLLVVRKRSAADGFVGEKLLDRIACDLGRRRGRIAG